MRIVNVLGFDGLYCVTDEGRVFSLKTGNELRQIDYGGYLYVHLHSNGLSFNLRVNRLVLSSFTKKDIDERFVVDHIDCDKHNNRLDNLRLLTNGENTVRGKSLKFPRGVCYYEHIKKYGANIQINHKRYFLGAYDTQEEASNTYEAALKRWKDNGIIPLSANERKNNTRKVCKRCGKDLPIDSFKTLSRGGHSNLCVDCEKEYKHEMYIKYKRKV